MQLVHEFLEHSAARTPDKIALVCDGQRLSYAALDAMANRLANALRARGVGRGDRVALYLPNSVELVVGIFAILKAGGTFVVVNSTTKHDKLVYMLGNCRASALIGLARQTQLIAQVIEQVPSLHTAVLVGDLACLIYTSGSTGDPKGVMSDHSNVVFAAGSIIQYLGNVEEDVVIGVLPLSFDYGLYQLLMTFKFGGTLVLEKGFTYPAAVLKRIEQERVTGLPGVPTIFAVLLQMDLSPYDLSSLRYITNTAAALPPSHILALRDKFPQATLYSMYGLTETKRTLYLPPEQLDRRPDSVGIAIPGTEVWLEDEMGRRLGPDQVGELVIRGRHVMRGYWERPGGHGPALPPRPVAWRAVCATRRPVPHGRRGLHVLRGAQGRHHQEPGREGGAQGSRERALQPARRGRGGCGGRARPDPGPGDQGLRGAGRRRAERGPGAGPLPGQPGGLHAAQVC
jgi:long-chain acyl-CoA synthetase